MKISIRKILALVLCCFLLTNICVTAYATGESNSKGVEFSVSLDKTSLEKKNEAQTVTMTMNMSKQTNIIDIEYDLICDSSFVVANPSVPGSMISSWNGTTRHMSAMAMTDVSTSSLGSVEITIPAGTQAGEYTIGIKNIRLSADGELSYWEDGASASATLTIVDPAPVVPDTYTVTVQNDGNGTASASHASAVAGTKIMLTATPNEGYQFKEWQVVSGGVTIENNKFTMPESNVTVKAIFEKVPVAPTIHTVSFDANGGTGTMADVTVKTGEYTLPECRFTAPAGKQFKGWATSENGNVITYLLVNSDITLYAIWEDIPTIPETDDDSFDWSLWYGQLTALYNQTFKITATASEGGSISPAGTTSVKFDKSVAYTITPEKGYEIKSVFVDDKDIGAVEEYTFKNVKKAHKISATFAKVIPFTDVDVDDWFYDDVVFVYKNGLMNGDSANTFSPYYGLNRATIVTVLWRLSGSPIVDINASFDDLDTDWYTDAMKWAINKGIILGYGDGTCRPLAEVTHEQISAIFHRYAELCELDTKDAASSISATYSDWAEADVLWAQANGLFDGFGSDLSDLTEIADRAEIAAYIHRFCELIED